MHRIQDPSSIGSAPIFFDEPGTAYSLKQEVVSTVICLFGFEDAAHAHDRLYGSFECVIRRFVTGLEQGDAHGPLIGKGVPHHAPIARLENVKRQNHAREQDGAGQGKNGYPSPKIDATTIPVRHFTHARILVTSPSKFSPVRGLLGRSVLEDATPEKSY